MRAEPIALAAEFEFSDEEAEEIASKAVAASTAASTLVGYKSRFNGFERFCGKHKLSALPAETRTVVKYLTYRSKQTAAKCVSLDRTAIRYYHRKGGYPDPTATELVTQIVAGIKRLYGTASRKKLAFTTDHVRAMCLDFDTEGGPMAMRNKAVTLVGFAAAFRANEAVASKVGAVSFYPEGAIILLEGSKTDQERKGEEVSIVNGEHPETNPVLALKEWFEIYEGLLGRKLVASDPVFPALMRVGDPAEQRVRLYRVPMTKTCYRDVLKAAAEKIGLDPKAVSGHSSRRGHATQAARNGASRADIAKQGRWRSTQVMDGYIAEGRRFADNSSRHLGL